MPTTDQGAPPLPPDVRRQQQGPILAQYAQAAARQNPMAAQSGQDEQANSMQFAQQKLSEVASGLMEIAKVLAVEKPALMPILKKMAGMGKVLEQQINEASQGQGAPIKPGSEPMKSGQTPPEGPASMAM